MSAGFIVTKRCDAMALGMSRYYTGKPCPRGHICERYLPYSGCVECCSIMTSEYKVRHPERAKASQAKWGLANRDKLRAKGRRKYLRNPALFKKHAKLRRLTKPEIVKAGMQRWRIANPDKMRIYDNTRRMLIAGAAGKHTAKEIALLLEKQNWRCVYCRVSLKDKYHVDHIMPIALGGSNDISNIQCLCQTCNRRKHAKDPIIFAQESGLLL